MHKGIFSQLFLMVCLPYYSPVNSVNKASLHVFHVLYVSTGNTPFQLTCLTVRCLPLFFSCIMIINPKRKIVYKTHKDRLHLYFSTLKKKPHQSKAKSCKCLMHNFYFLRASNICSCGCVRTNTHR